MSEPRAEQDGREVFVSLWSEETHAEHHHCPGRCVSPATARRLAAELLAAANACETPLPPETERVLRSRVTGGRLGPDQEPERRAPRFDETLEFLNRDRKVDP